MIELKHVSKWYGQTQVLNDCSTQIALGEVVVICGPSGSGKSTLIKTINALEPIQQGEIYVDGVPVHDPATSLPTLRSHVGMVFQHFELFPHLSVMENLTLAQIKVLGRSVDQATTHGLKYLERVGLLAHKDKYPAQLSGGQQQRVAMAQAWTLAPQMLLLDEPTASLDPHAKAEVESLLQAFAQAHPQASLVFASHNLGQVKRLASRVLYLERGRLLADLPVAQFFDSQTLLAHCPSAHLFVKGELA